MAQLQQALAALEPLVREEHARIQGEVRLLQGLMIGLILPPVAETVFVISKLANLGYGALARRTMPFLGAYLVVLILITYIPFFTTWLPEILF